MTQRLLTQHAPSDRVAFGARGSRRIDDLLRDAARVRAVLPAPVADSYVLLAIRADSYAFAAALLGTWVAGHSVAIPPVDVTREVFLQLAQRKEAAAVLHDTVSGAPIRIDRLLAQPATVESEQPLSISELARHDLGVTFFRWTESRELQSHTVRRSQLQDETLELAQRYALPTRAHALSCLAPDSRCGLMLAVLWPLLSGGALLREPMSHTSARVKLSDDSAQRVLLAAPAQLRMLLRSQPELFGALTHVVSAGGALPLPQQAAACLRDFPRLKLHDLGEQRVVGTDRDAELEEQLAWLPGVADAAVLPLPAANAMPARRYLALAADGCSETTLRARLADHLPLNQPFDRVVILTQPSAALVRGGAGEHQRDRLLRLFELSAAGRPLSFEVAIRSDRALSNGHIYRVHVPADYVYFEGHFPGYPILPGAAQLSELVLPCVRRARPELGRLVRMARLKFQERIKPDELIDVFIAHGHANATDPLQIDFTLKRGETPCATGRLTFAAAEPQP